MLFRRTLVDFLVSMNGCYYQPVMSVNCFNCEYDTKVEIGKKKKVRGKNSFAVLPLAGPKSPHLEFFNYFFVPLCSTYKC